MPSSSSDPLVHPRNLYVASLPSQIPEQEVRKLFQRFGEIEGLRLVPGTRAGGFNAYAFVLFRKEDSANRAINGLLDYSIDGSRIQVRRARQTPNVDPFAVPPLIVPFLPFSPMGSPSPSSSTAAVVAASPAESTTILRRELTQLPASLLPQPYPLTMGQQLTQPYPRAMMGQQLPFAVANAAGAAGNHLLGHLLPSDASVASSGCVFGGLATAGAAANYVLLPASGGPFPFSPTAYSVDASQFTNGSHPSNTAMPQQAFLTSADASSAPSWSGGGVAVAVPSHPPQQCIQQQENHVGPQRGPPFAHGIGGTPPMFSSFTAVDDCCPVHAPLLPGGERAACGSLDASSSGVGRTCRESSSSSGTGQGAFLCPSLPQMHLQRLLCSTSSDGTAVLTVGGADDSSDRSNNALSIGAVSATAVVAQQQQPAARQSVEVVKLQRADPQPAAVVALPQLMNLVYSRLHQ